MRIAIVEDDVALSHLLGEVLEWEGHRVLACLRADGALDAICLSQVDLILLDLRLEERDSGWRLLHILRGDPRTANTPVVVCSGDAQTLQDNASWLQAERIPAVLKPFDLDNLLTVIAGGLRARQVSPRAAES